MNSRKKIKVVSTNGQQARSEESSTSPPRLMNEDRLSSLPDSLLVSILSLLKVKDAASTSVLSHRWRYLWTKITRLILTCRGVLGHIPEAHLVAFIPAVDRIFQQLNSPNFKTFRLFFPSVRGDILCRKSAAALEAWLGRLCALNVEEITVYDLYFYNDNLDTNVTVPVCGFSCQWKSLVKLEIEGNFELKLPVSDDGAVYFPNLKTLFLTLHVWDCEVMATLFKNCPVLEQLHLIIIEEDLEGKFIYVSCPNLRSMTLDCWKSPKVQGWKFVIHTPRLELLNFDGPVSSCLMFVDKLRSIIKAEITLWLTRKDDDCGQLSYLVQGISSVRSLKLNSHLLYPFLPLGGSTHPSFYNLTQLEICLVDTSVCNNYILHCLRRAHLEVLLIEMPKRSGSTESVKWPKWVVPDFVPGCLSSKLIRIQVKGFQGSAEDLKFLVYILNNGTVLEWLHVHVSSSKGNLEDESHFCRNLFGCTRSSNTCVIQFRGTHLHASSTGFNQSLGTLDCQIQPIATS